MPDPRVGKLQRSYERNLGYAKFWIGVCAAFLGAFVAFAAEKLWEISTNPDAYAAPVWTALFVSAWILVTAATVSLTLASTFIIAYQRDDIALTEIEQGNDDAS